jgi:hypothetical protein
MRHSYLSLKSVKKVEFLLDSGLFFRAGRPVKFECAHLAQGRSAEKEEKEEKEVAFLDTAC